MSAAVSPFEELGRRRKVERFTNSLIASARIAKVPLCEVADAIEDGDVDMRAVAATLDERPVSSETRIQIVRALRILGAGERA